MNNFEDNKNQTVEENVDEIQSRLDASEKENTRLQHELENTTAKISELEKQIEELNAENAELKKDIFESLTAFQKIDVIYKDAPKADQHTAGVTKRTLERMDRRLIGIMGDIDDILKEHALIREEIGSVCAILNLETAEGQQENTDGVYSKVADSAPDNAGETDGLKTEPETLAEQSGRTAEEIIEHASDYSKFGRKSRLSSEERTKLLEKALAQNE